MRIVEVVRFILFNYTSMRLQDRNSDYEPRYRATKTFWKLIKKKSWREYTVWDIYYNIVIIKNKKAD